LPINIKSASPTCFGENHASLKKIASDIPAAIYKVLQSLVALLMLIKYKSTACTGCYKTYS